MRDVHSIEKDSPAHAKLFSLCCIVNDLEEYAEMQRTFVENGFDEDCEYLIADNTKGAAFDAYEAINLFIKRAVGKYIIVVHQDVRALDSKATLLHRLNELEEVDKNWAVCGNAGGIHYHEKILYLRHANKDSITTKKLPRRVRTLDENFLVIKRDAQPAVSTDISGFHLYGTDMCLLAQIKGQTCYVISFLVRHLSEGDVKALWSFEKGFVRQYGKKLNVGFVQTTCTRFFLSNSAMKNAFWNQPMVFFCVKGYLAARRSMVKLLGREA